MMGKALLVLDETVEKCMDCPCYNETVCYCNPIDRNVRDAVNAGTKPDWCPLIPMPERKEVMRCGGSFNIFDYEQKGRQEGWNDCIDAICAEAEKVNKGVITHRCRRELQTKQGDVTEKD